MPLYVIILYPAPAPPCVSPPCLPLPLTALPTPLTALPLPLTALHAQPPFKNCNLANLCLIPDALVDNVLHPRKSMPKP